MPILHWLTPDKDLRAIVHHFRRDPVLLRCWVTYVHYPGDPRAVVPATRQERKSEVVAL